MRTAIAVGFALSLSATAFASPGTTVMHTNGVFVSQRAAQRHALEIGSLASAVSSFDKYGSVATELLFQSADSPVGEPLLSTLDAIVEEMEPNQAGRDAMFSRIARRMFNLSAPPEARIEAAIEDFKKSMSVASYSSRPEFSSFVARYKASLKNGRRVILVAHSQGNRFANEAYEKLFSEYGASSRFKRSIGQVGLATPTSFLSDGRGLHVKFANDWARCLSGTPMAPNLGSASTPSSLSWKDFCFQSTGDDNASDGAHRAEAYLLSEASSRVLVSQHLTRLAQELEHPFFVADISPHARDAMALDDLNNDTNNKNPETVLLGKFLYVEGAGLAGASFEVPGVADRLVATEVPIPPTHPLSSAGTQVWKLSIPQTALAGTSGAVKAHLAVAGLDGVYESPRAVRVAEDQPFCNKVDDASGLVGFQSTPDVVRYRNPFPEAIFVYGANASTAREPPYTYSSQVGLQMLQPGQVVEIPRCVGLLWDPSVFRFFTVKPEFRDSFFPEFDTSNPRGPTTDAEVWQASCLATLSMVRSSCAP